MAHALCLHAAAAGVGVGLRVGASDLEAALEGFTPAAYWGVGKLSGADAASQVTRASGDVRLLGGTSALGWPCCDVDVQSGSHAIMINADEVCLCRQVVCTPSKVALFNQLVQCIAAARLLA